MKYLVQITATVALRTLVASLNEGYDRVTAYVTKHLFFYRNLSTYTISDAVHLYSTGSAELDTAVTALLLGGLHVWLSCYKSASGFSNTKHTHTHITHIYICMYVDTHTHTYIRTHT